MVAKTSKKISEAQKQQIHEQTLAYQQDPCGFFVNCLDVKEEYLWSKMREVAESVRDNQFTAVPAAHSVSKTFTAARVVGMVQVLLSAFNSHYHSSKR